MLCTWRRVAALTRSGLDRAREAVDTATPASSATSCRVTARRFAAVTSGSPGGFILPRPSNAQADATEYWQALANICQCWQFLPYLVGDGNGERSASGPERGTDHTRTRVGRV